MVSDVFKTITLSVTLLYLPIYFVPRVFHCYGIAWPPGAYVLILPLPLPRSQSHLFHSLLTGITLGHSGCHGNPLTPIKYVCV